MEKEYMKFVETLRHSLLEVTDYQEEMISFKKGDEYPRTAGDRLLLKTARQEGVYEVCALYVRELYEGYLKGWSIESIVQEVIHRLEAVMKSECFKKTRDLEDYDKIKGDLFIRLLNLDRNREELQDSIYQTVGDIALVLYARLGELEGNRTSIKIKRHILEKWEKDEGMVFENALLNTYFLSPPRIYYWEKLFFDSDYEGENFMNLLADIEIGKDVVGNCLSTTIRTNGAVAIFLPGVADRIGNLMNGGFYMAFTSVHEVMIHSDRYSDPEDLKAILKETVEDSTPEEDFLTYYIYHYDPATGEFTYC